MYKVQVNIDYKWTYALVDDWTADAVVTSVWSNLRLKFPSCAGLWLSGPDAYNGDRGEKKKNENIIDTNTHPDRIRYRCLVLRLKCVPCLLVVLGDGSKDLPSHMPRLALPHPLSTPATPSPAPFITWTLNGGFGSDLTLRNFSPIFYANLPS